MGQEYNGLIRWGIIGCGNVTEVKSGPAYQQTEGFELSAVMRRDPEKLKDYANRHGIAKYYTDADELINDEAIDAIYIATPPDSHMYYALKVAEAGKTCCVEKPLAPSFKESQAIEKAFREKGIPLFVAYYRRSLPRFNQVKTWLEHQSIGTIRHISWHFCRPPKPIDLTNEYNWRTDPKVAPGGYFDDLASHGLDLFAYLLGDLKEVHGIRLNQQGLYGAFDAISACWLHDNGTTGVGVWNFGCDQYEDRVEIFGSEGKIQFAIFKEEPLVLTSKNGSSEVFIENPKHIQQYHVENIAKQLRDETVLHPSTGQSATHTSWIMNQILSLGK
ncbi:MAG: Gfo/Idh/MocA family oxidoreductase [Phaeodactylibacter sp.]|nr:Gfo/Idh/MocA family oxidoreductase [Phaeodactylibacter sp.]